MSYLAWPFKPIHQQTVEQTAQWWEHCYVPGDAARYLDNVTHWCLLVGESGSGKTVTLKALQQRTSSGFFIDYPPDRWPDGAKRLSSTDSHLAQMMATASIKLRDFLTRNPDQLAKMDDLEQEFVRWLVERAGGKRAFIRWTRSLPPTEREAFESVESEDLFPTTTDALDIQGQIDELVNLIRLLGFDRVVFIVDVNLRQAVAQLDALGDLFGQLEMMHRIGFSVIGAVPERFPHDESFNLMQYLTEQSRGRLSVARLTGSTESGRQIAQQHLRFALGNPNATLDEFATQTLLTQISAFVEEEYGAQLAGGWVKVCETLLYLYSSQIELADFDEFKYHFCRQHVPLRLDNKMGGVWRGKTFIGLEGRSFEFLELLFRFRGHPIHFADGGDIVSIVSSPAGMHTIASRVRAKVEIDSNRPIYITSKRGEGYRVENFAD